MGRILRWLSDRRPSRPRATARRPGENVDAASVAAERDAGNSGAFAGPSAPTGWVPPSDEGRPRT